MSETPDFVAITGASVFSPDAMGLQTMLIIGQRIAKMGAVDAKALGWAGLEGEIIDATGCIVIPGFIDPHQNIIGAGGEQGFTSRMPEVPFSAIVSAGITTVVGSLGTDNVTRPLVSMLAKVYQLEAEGLSAFMCTGGFSVPPHSITGSVYNDILLIEKVIGVGQVAIADIRSSEPTLDELAALVSAANVAGSLSGKAGVTHFHVGESERRLKIIHRLIDEHDLQVDRLYPTHIARSRELLDDAIRLAKRGASIDMDTTEHNIGKWLHYYLENDGPPERLTISTDAHTPDASPSDMYTEFVSCVKEHGLSLVDILPHFTTNAAKILKLRGKGQLAAGADADLLILDEATLEIRDVFAKGVQVVRNGQVIKTGQYEKFATPHQTSTTREMQA